MVLNIVEDPSQLLMPDILEKLHVIIINGNIAVVDPEELALIDMETKRISYGEYLKEQWFAFCRRTSLLNHLAPKPAHMSQSVLQIKNLNDLAKPIDPKTCTLSAPSLEKKINGLLKTGSYTLFLSKNDALLGQNLFEYDYQQKQTVINEQLFLESGNQTGGSFSQSLRVSFDKKPHITIQPLKTALPNMYSLLDMYVEKTQRKTKKR